MIDPRSRVREVALDVWTGNEPAEGRRTRPPADSQPAAERGDSRRLRAKLTYENRVARGEVVLPALKPGQVYWVQPNWVSAGGQARWAAANTWAPPKDSPPVSRKPALLALRTRAPGGMHDLVVSATNTFRLSGSEEDEDEAPLLMRSRVTLQEKPSVYGAGVVLNLHYREASRVRVIDKKEEQDGSLNNIRHLLPQLRAQVLMDNRGDLTGTIIDPALANSFARSPFNRGNWDTIQQFHEMVWQGMRTLSVTPLPGRQVRPAYKWKGTRPVLLEAPVREGFNHFPPAQLDLTYTYVGQRKNAAGRDEAVIDIEGLLHGGPSGGGKAAGSALLDLGNGQVSRADLAVTLDLPIERRTEKGVQKMRVICVQHMRLERHL
jgi:hypothetical protein